MAEDEVITAQVAESHAIAAYGPLVSIVVLVWVFFLHVSPSFYYTFPMGISLGLWRIIAIAVLAIVLGAEAYHFYSMSVGPSEEEAVDGEGPVKKKTLEYPPKITGVIYADTYIPLGEAEDIKVRTMLARTCALCDKSEECWDKVKGKMEEEDFLSNMECKEGLRELGASI